MKFVWNVWRHNINSGLMEMWNIFEHYNFNKDVESALIEYDSKEGFTRYVQTSLMYYFWAKSEYEIVLSPWCGKNAKEKLVDIYEQVMANWPHFIEYLWSFKKYL